MTVVSPAEGYRLWSAGYDNDANPVTALERRLLQARLTIDDTIDANSVVLDVATGTGRWLAYAILRGARGIGIDISAEMLAVASMKSGLRGRLALADIRRLPFAENAADLAICSFALGYIASIENVFHEMTRVARRVIVSDLHPEAVRAGWSRSFRAEQQDYDIEHHYHSVEGLNSGARAAGLSLEWDMHARFEEPERAIFRRAGKDSAFASARQVNAVLISSWVK